MTCSKTIQNFDISEYFYHNLMSDNVVKQRNGLKLFCGPLGQTISGNSSQFVNEHDVSDVSPTQPSVEHFAGLDCPPEAFYSGTGLAHIDGQVKPGAKCEIKCIEGFHIERDEHMTQCVQTFEHDFEWNVLAYTLSKYDDCYSSSYSHPSGAYSCSNFPICVPDGYTWLE